MKKLIWGLLIFGVIMQLPTLGQSDWQVKAFAGVSDAAFLGDVLDGGPSMNVDRFQEYGVRLSWQGNSKWGLETGITYAKATLQLGTMWIPTGNPPPRPVSLLTITPTPFEYISVPILATYELVSFLSLQAGPLLGFQQSEYSSWMEQSGVGYLVGVNLQHYFDRLGVFLQPNFKQHAAIGFNQSNTRLTEFGLQLGVAYQLSSKRVN
ncbi:hypothetical protein [Mongoliitalea daihaiensis]|uniref:hypothetical protein n=1 Tax=Mongoliitalea daihaiensis TaxID=2782006 RepID=UPI001F1F912F|nr:hypothetical protein [Mongoliitalea daihaiensis]UJP66840.1 outer membrane beta-barrel protein [Mongoliitalea daihaiensis]